MCLRVFHQSNSILPQYTLLHHVLFPFITYSNHIVQPHQKEFAQKLMGLTVNFPYNSPMFYLTQSHVNSSYNQSAFFMYFAHGGQQPIEEPSLKCYPFLFFNFSWSSLIWDYDVFLVRVYWRYNKLSVSFS